MLIPHILFPTGFKNILNNGIVENIPQPRGFHPGTIPSTVAYVECGGVADSFSVTLKSP